MKFDPNEFVFIVNHFECMRTITMHKTEAIGYTTFGIKKHKLEKIRYEYSIFQNEISLDALPLDDLKRNPIPYLHRVNVFVDFVFANE